MEYILPLFFLLPMDGIGENILDKASAKINIDHLMPPANPQNRSAGFDKFIQEGQLGFVKLTVCRNAARHLLPVQVGAQVLTPRKNQKITAGKIRNRQSRNRTMSQSFRHGLERGQVVRAPARGGSPFVEPDAVISPSTSSSMTGCGHDVEAGWHAGPDYLGTRWGGRRLARLLFETVIEGAGVIRL